MRPCEKNRRIQFICRDEVMDMGFLDAILGSGNHRPMVTSILPIAAKQEIMSGRLPILNTNQLFLKKGEKIHYIDKAINLEIKKIKRYKHVGHSGPGVFKGNRYNVGVSKPLEFTEYVHHRGILYVTNQRIVFQASEWGFDKTYKYVTAISPYSDGCEIQFGNKSYNIFVADGNLLYRVLQLVKQRRQIP